MIVMICAAFGATCVGCVTQTRHESSAALRPIQTQAPTLVVNLNTATPAQLEQLPGVGKSLAERIVNYRERYGGFRRTEHVLMVRGISERKFREMQASLGVE